MYPVHLYCTNLYSHSFPTRRSSDLIIDTREKKIHKHILNKFEEGFENKPSHHDMYRGKKSTYSDPVDYYIQEKGLKVGDYTIARSEEHTSELQSRFDLVCRLLLEKK